jgi:kinesin family protein 18/19
MNKQSNNRLKNTKNQNTEQYQYYNNLNSPSGLRINPQSLADKFNKNNMLVAVRARPLTKSELEDSNYNTISVPNKDTITITFPTEYIPDDMSEIYLAGEQIKITKTKEVSYNYDFVFNEKTSQNEVYRYTTSSLINQVVDGFSATILAYGATGSGKTYTMVGKGENTGLMIRSIRDLFKVVNSDQSKAYSIKISYIEIYNEVLKDLLTDKSKSPPELRTDPKKGVVLQGAENKVVLNEEEAFKLINMGNKRRTEKQTDRNQFSSRSHAVLQIYLEIQDQLNVNYDNYNNINSEASFGKFILVDLAGSEKTSSSSKGNSETGSINKSLLALGKCINLIVSQNKKFIPFRESKLTRILQEPLSGNGRIVMIATISPSIVNYDETLFTLQFANRAKSMKIYMKKNVVETDKQLIKKYADYIQTLKEQINEVERDIFEQQNSNSANISINEGEKKESIQNSLNNSHYVHDERIDQIQKDMISHFQEEVNLKQKIIEEENKMEELKNDSSDLNYQIVHKPRVNVEYLVGELENKKKEIEEIQEKINGEYIKENELISKRKEFQDNINELKSNSSGNTAQIKNLFNIYKYYTNLIENMSNEHRRFVNNNELKRKENKISLLTEQLNLRDLFIDNAKQELSKNNIKLEYKDPNFASQEEIEMEPYNPKVVKVSPSYNSLIEISKNRDMGKTKSDINNINEQNTIVTDSGAVNVSRFKNVDRNERFNSISKFNNKVKLMVTGKNNKNNVNKFNRNASTNTKGRTLANAGENAIKNNYAGGGNVYQKVRINPTKQNYMIDDSEVGNDQPLLQNLMLEKRDNKNINQVYNYSSYNNNFSFYNNPVEVTNTTRLENEVQKKVKTILKKDFIGRYKRSPYLRLLNE